MVTIDEESVYIVSVDRNRCSTDSMSRAKRFSMEVWPSCADLTGEGEVERLYIGTVEQVHEHRLWLRDQGFASNPWYRLIDGKELEVSEQQQLPAALDAIDRALRSSPHMIWVCYEEGVRGYVEFHTGFMAGTSQRLGADFRWVGTGLLNLRSGQLLRHGEKLPGGVDAARWSSRDRSAGNPTPRYRVAHTPLITVWGHWTGWVRARASQDHGQPEQA